MTTRSTVAVAVIGGGVLVSTGPALRVSSSGRHALAAVLVLVGLAAAAGTVGVLRRSALLAGLGGATALGAAILVPPDGRTSLAIVCTGAVVVSVALVPHPPVPRLPHRRIEIVRPALGVVALGQLTWWAGRGAPTLLILAAALLLAEWYRYRPDAAAAVDHRLDWSVAWIRRDRWRRDDVVCASAHKVRDLDRFQRWFLAVALGSIVVMSAALFHELRTDGWTQVGDEANQIFGARQAFELRPLLGDLNTANLYGNPVSRHPGPVAWYVLAPWVLWIGPTTGAWLFALMWNLASIVTASWLALRCGGFRCGAVMLVGAPLAFAIAAPGQYASTFFQVLPLLPLLVCLVGSWALARGDTIALPLVAATATFVVQSATLNLPLVLLCAAVGTIGAARHLSAGTAVDGRVGWHLGLGIAVLLILWAPTVWDQFFDSGNLGKLLAADIPHAGVAGMGDLVRWAGVSLRGIPLGIYLLATVAVLGNVVAKRHAQVPRRDAALLTIAVAVIVGSGITAALLPADDVESSHWMWVPMVLLFLTTAAVAALFGEGPLSGLAVAAGWACAGVVLVHSLGELHRPQVSRQDLVAMRAVSSVLPQILAAAPDGKLRVSSRGGFAGVRIVQGLFPLLDERGRVGSYSNYELSPWEGPSLVVIRGGRTPWHDGELVASFEPPSHAGRSPDLLNQVAAWARAHGPIQLAPHAEVLIANIVDGRTRAVCIEDLLRTPDLLLDLPPDVLASLYGAGLVTAPALPTHITQHVLNWQADQRVDVLLLSIPDGRPGDLAFSTSSC